MFIAGLFTCKCKKISKKSINKTPSIQTVSSSANITNMDSDELFRTLYSRRLANGDVVSRVSDTVLYIGDVMA